MELNLNRTLQSVLSHGAQPSCCISGVSHTLGLRPCAGSGRVHGRLRRQGSSRKAILQRHNLGRFGAAMLERVEPGPAEEEGPMGVILVDSGANNPGSELMLEQFASLYRTATKRNNVEVARLESSASAFEQAVRGCVQRGAMRVVVVPYFLSNSTTEASKKIPYLVADVQQSLPGVKCVIAEPIGLDSLMVDLIENRVSPLEPWGGPKVAERSWAGGVLGSAPGARSAAAGATGSRGAAAGAAGEAGQGSGVAAEVAARGPSVTDELWHGGPVVGEPALAPQNFNSMTMSAERAWEVASQQVSAAAWTSTEAACQAGKQHATEPAPAQQAWEAEQQRQHGAAYVTAERAWEAEQQQHGAAYIPAERAWEAAQQQHSAAYVPAERVWEAAQQQHSATYVPAERAWEAAQQPAHAAPTPKPSMQETEQPSTVLTMEVVAEQGWEAARQQIFVEVVPEVMPVPKAAVEAAPVPKAAVEAVPVSKVVAEVVPEVVPVSNVAAEATLVAAAGLGTAKAGTTETKTQSESSAVSEGSGNSNPRQGMGLRVDFSWLFTAVRTLANPWAWFTRRSKSPKRAAPAVPATATAFSASDSGAPSKFDPLGGRPLQKVSVPKGRCKYDPVRGVLDGGWVAPVMAVLCVATAAVQGMARGLGNAQEALDRAKGAVMEAQRQPSSSGAKPAPAST